MTSSMLTGERRWASSGRRGGMTVIGKVVVPKPINLPSQRLENHGLDPNVEIVPKGTLSWGSKSSTASNPWGSSSLSPNTDGGGGSPSRLSGRPSSGGSGTRPSTAGSDRAYEPTNNAWGQNSRPSSASGLVTSNQTTLTSLRPRSAETRPGSSHLSRFAESVSENSGAWGAAGTAEKLGVTSSKVDGFSLATGDFPTLGSEKDNSEKNIESQDHESHDRPGSSSGRVAPAKERNATLIDGSCESSVDANVKNSTANSWRRENPAYGEDAARPNVEKWHGDPHPYPNANIRPQHYEAWRGPPVNNPPPPPGGVWYRGPPGAPPFGNPVPPCGFPMEPFPYFHPQMPGASLANPQPVPPPGSGPRGHHPKNGDMYRPHMPDAYIRPGMPIRPGFYPGPVPYDGYYGPPMGYCNSNERDIPFMGMAAGPAVYNRYSGQNGPDPGNSHSRSGGYGPSGKALLEHEDSGHPHDTRGPYKVLLKQHNGLDERDDQKWEGSPTTNATSSKEKSDQPRKLQENEWGADHKDERMNPRRKAVGEESSHQTSDSRGGPPVRTKLNSSENTGNRKAVDDISVKKSEHVESSFPESQQPHLATPKDSSLIQKIEGLNAKARDARHDVLSFSNRDGHGNTFQVVKANHSANEVGSGSVNHDKTHSSRVSTPPSREGILSTGDRHLESVNAGGVALSRRSHGMQGRADHRGKGRINTQEGDGWRKRSPVLASPNMISAAQTEISSVVSVQGHHTSTEAFEKPEAYPQMKDEREAGLPMFDPNDPQRAKMKELAQQRLKQRQKEEEERISRQKANARAKLEELNRRTQTVEGLGNKSGPNQNNKEESQVLSESMTATGKLEGLSLTSHPNFAAQISESNTGSVERSTLSSSEPALEMPECAPKQPVSAQNLSAYPQHDSHNADARKNASQAHDGGMSKQKRMDSKQKQNMSLEKSVTEKLSSISVPEALKGHHDVPVKTIVSAEVATDGSSSNFEPTSTVNPNVNVESTVHQRRKNRGAKNKHKVDTVTSVASLPSSALKESNPSNIYNENGKPKASESELPPSLLQSVMASEDANQSTDQHSSLPHEDSHVRVNSLSKSQHSRRMQRNPLNSRTAEKFHSGDAVVWAPVRSHNRAEVADEASNKTVVEAVTSLKCDSGQNNNPKSKRAEIEIYIPKPVAKELAQLGSIQQPAGSSFGQDASNEAVDSIDTGSQGTVCRQPASYDTGKVGFAMESRNADGRPNKQGKPHGSWRQRGASESASTQLQDGLSHTSNSNRNVQKSVEHQQPKKSGMSLLGKEQLKFSSEENTPDILSIPDNSESVHVVKDQGVTGRVKRQPYRGHKNTGNSHEVDHKKMNSGDTDKVFAQSMAPQISQTDLASKENRVAGERSITHWQPKSQSFSATNQQSSQSDGGQNFYVEVSTGKKKESSTQHGMPLPSQHKDTGKSVAQPHHDHYASVKSNVDEALNVGHQEAKREKKTALLRGRPLSPNQGSVGSVEPASGSADIQHEHRSYSGFRKNGNQNSRMVRGQDSHGDWSSAGQDNRQHNQPPNRERQRQNAPHYEYQPVGPYNNNSKSSNEGPNDRSQNMGGRFRDRGQGHSRRGGGNFYGRQTDSV